MRYSNYGYFNPWAAFYPSAWNPWHDRQGYFPWNPYGYWPSQEQFGYRGGPRERGAYRNPGRFQDGGRSRDLGQYQSRNRYHNWEESHFGEYDNSLNDEMPRCSMCHNHCPLNALSCGKGRRAYGVF